MINRANDTGVIIKRLLDKLKSQYSNDRHLETAAGGIFFTCAKNNIDLNSLLDDIENGTAFDFEKFWNAKSGDLLSYLKPYYHPTAQSIIDITAGGNGGMGSVGRGEFFISFFSNFLAKMITSGNGDIAYGGRNEELKYNGGKISVSGKTGEGAYKKFVEIATSKNLDFKRDKKKKNFLPTRKGDVKLYSPEEYNILVGCYYTALTEEDCGPIDIDTFSLKCLETSSDNLFKKSDSLLVIDKNNHFNRFYNTQEVLDYYSNKTHLYHAHRKWECRATQKNEVAMYVG